MQKKKADYLLKIVLRVAVIRIQPLLNSFIAIVQILEDDLEEPNCFLSDTIHVIFPEKRVKDCHLEAGSICSFSSHWKHLQTLQKDLLILHPVGNFQLDDPISPADLLLLTDAARHNWEHNWKADPALQLFRIDSKIMWPQAKKQHTLPMTMLPWRTFKAFSSFQCQSYLSAQFKEALAVKTQEKTQKKEEQYRTSKSSSSVSK